MTEVEKQLTNLKNQRKALKSKLTRFCHFLDVETNQSDITQISLRLESLGDIVDSFGDIQLKIEALTSESSDDLADFENLYYHEITRARNFIKAADNRSITINASNTPSTSSSTRSIRLPKIELATFDGSYDKWLDFHDSFKNVIDSEKSLSNVDKLHYLRSCLKDEAASVVKALESTDENYAVAWNLLKERFDNRRLIIQTHVRTLMELPTLNKESPTDLRKLLDRVKTHMRALKSLEEKVDSWDTLLIYVITLKLDRVTHKEWEKSLTRVSMPSMVQFLDFLEQRCQILQATAFNIMASNNKFQSSSQVKRQAFVSSGKVVSCLLCKEAHHIYACDKFRAMTASEKYKVIRAHNACINCLKTGHYSSDCKSQGCKRCNKKHNSLLHYDRQDHAEVTTNKDITEASSTSVKVLNAVVTTEVLLSTALVDVETASGKKVRARVLLDSGSQSNFMTKDFAKLLGIQFQSIKLPVEGLNQIETIINEALETRVYSKHTSYNMTLRFLILPHICNYVPSQRIDKRQLNIPANIKLADPEFHNPGKIDALLGAEIFYDLLCIGQIQLAGQGARITKTKLGWIISGKIGEEPRKSKLNKCFLSLDTLHKSVNRFWELEEIAEKRLVSEEEFLVEEHYKQTTRRDKHTGRYIVRLPFNENISKLGNSFHLAYRRFLALERRLSREPEVREQYNQFMKEYLELGHMKEVSEAEEDVGYFMPHHAVIKETSQTTKLRVVFDASARTHTGLSLNNCLMNGPIIQQDIFSIVVRFRTHQYVIIADVEKMFRQISMDTQDAPYQRLLHREHENDKLKIFQATTVTYGTTPAPFLAIRTLFQLADDEEANFPLASKIIKRDFYVDDLLSGADTIKETIKLRNDLLTVTARGGFTLRKWQSNSEKVIESGPSEKVNADLLMKTEVQKTLGVQWDSNSDTFTHQVKPWENSKVTKRKILSHIAQLYDPIGLLGPVIVQAKLLMQRLWQCEVTWDESVPADIFTSWINIRNQLGILEKIQFDRRVIIQDCKTIEIHGFSDASEKAYGACLYVRSVSSKNETLTALLCSKNRVAPLKTISLPKLELCAALLLARLLKATLFALDRQIDNVFLWSDSTITLQWIQTQPYLLKTFVANRVAEIRNLTRVECWRHVPTYDNPADFLSRGQLPSEFMANQTWKTGPGWLIREANHWPTREFKKVPLTEMKSTLALNAITKHNQFSKLLSNYSSFTKLQRVWAYCLRFTQNLKNRDTKITGPLQTHELKQSLTSIVKLVQQEAFQADIRSLVNSKQVRSTSSLKALNPFIDKEGLIRVGGRLSNSKLGYCEKHPLILPKNHHVTNLIIKLIHLKHFHSGTQATLYAIREKFWPIAGRNSVKRVINQCIQCCRAKPYEYSYIMGDLPRDRVTPTRPFLNTGIDYCGPFFVKERKFRNRNKLKVYAAVFVCFSTKACHIELVTDLTTSAFLAALRRFFARRGKSANIYSDNATNFVGANRELKILQNFIQSKSHNHRLTEVLANDNITWHFLPPRSPHFGGLWEAAVKSFKRLFSHTIGDTLFTYEELYTYTTEIEAILNSRPITPISSDPNDLNALCPSHFLIGDSLMSVPEQDITDTKVNRLSTWQHIQYVKQHFWKRWSKEYLNNLNVRSKWHQQKADNIKIGTMVILKQNDVKPLHWPLGRIVSVHPGADGIVRAVTVKTITGVYDRSVKSVAPLPIN